MADLRIERTAEVVVTRPDGTRQRGSGYLVATGLVLTAAHVVRDAQTIAVRFNPDRSDEWSAPARAGWFSRDPTDAVLLVLDPGPESPSPRVEPVGFGAPGVDNAVLTCSTAGFPRFKMRERSDGSRAREICHAWGHIPVLSNRRTGTLEFRVPPPERTERGSPWEGMSGAAVWSGGRVIGIVVEHHRAEGPGSLTVSRADGWAGTDEGGPGAELLRRAGLDAPVEHVGPSAPDSRPADGYRAQARSVAPSELRDRKAELQALVRFCAGPGGYQWWQAPPWHGKTALTAWLAAHPPDGVAVAAFFVTRLDAGQCDSDAFAQAMADQLGAIAGESPVRGTAPGLQVREWRRLLEAAALRQGRHGRLLVIVDGLDEDVSQAAGPPRPSIASLLPRHLPEGVAILVTSRPGPGLPADVPGDHPLRTCEPRSLTASPHATRLRFEAEHELRGLLTKESVHAQVIGLLAAAGEGLSRDELSALTGLPARRLDELTSGALGRSLAERRSPVFLDDTADVRTALVFAHDTLLDSALRLLGDELPAYRERVHRWADAWRRRGWPSDTPHFLLSGYGRMVLASRDPRLLARVFADPVQHDRMASRLLGDGPALAELRAARHVVAVDDSDDGLRTATLLAAEHDRLTTRHRDADEGELTWLRARLGQTDRAQALAEAIPDGAAKCFALIRLADFLLESEPHRALGLAGAAAALVQGAPLSSYRPVHALAAVRAGGLLLRLGSPEGPPALHTALAMVAAERAARQETGDDTEGSPWTDEVLLAAAEAFGAAADLEGVRAVWSTDSHTRGRSAPLVRALTALARQGHGAAPDRLPDAPWDTSSDSLAWPAALRAAWPTALAAAGRGEDAWGAVADVEPRHRDGVLAPMGEAFAEAGDLAQALRAARAVTEPAPRRRAMLDLVVRMPNAGEALRLIEEACPHGQDTAVTPADWPCGGSCAALRVRALGILDRWEEALAVAALPHTAAFRQEVRRQLLTALALRDRWQQARELLARHRAEEEPEDWIRAAVSLMYVGSDTGRPEAAALAEELLLTPPEPLSREERLRLESLAVAVLGGAGHWQALISYFSTHEEPLRRLSLESGTAAGVADAVAEALARRPERKEEALHALCPVFGADSWRAALARACARQGQWRTAASLARGVAEPMIRRSALIRVAAAVVEREPRAAAALADEAERTPPIAHPDRHGPGAERRRLLIGFAEALAAGRPADAVRAARAAQDPTDTEELRGRCAVTLARAGDSVAALALLGQLRDRRRRSRTQIALVAAIVGRRPDEARRLVTDLIGSKDPAAIPECLALLAQAGIHSPGAGDELRHEAVRWAVASVPGVEDTVECLAGVLRHCPASDRTAVSAAVRGLADVLDAGLRPDRVLPLAVEAAVASEPFDSEAAGRFASGALEAAAGLDPVTPGDRPASAIADATALLCRVGDPAGALRLPRSAVTHGRGDILPVLLAGAAAGTVTTVPDWAAAQAHEAAGLLREYRGGLGVLPALGRQEFTLPEPVLDCAIVTARALAALADRPAAEALLEHVRSPWQRDIAWARLARALAADAGRVDADRAVRQAADWALRRALAGDQWAVVLADAAVRDADTVAEACALTLDAAVPPSDPDSGPPNAAQRVGPSL